MMINMERRNVFDIHWWIFSWLLYMTHFFLAWLILLSILATLFLPLFIFVLTITHPYPYYPCAYKPILHSFPISTLYSHALSFNWLSLLCSDDIIVALGFVYTVKASAFLFQQEESSFQVSQVSQVMSKSCLGSLGLSTSTKSSYISSQEASHSHGVSHSHKSHIQVTGIRSHHVVFV